MLTPLWSARVTSRFTKALPACDVKENAGLKLTMTPQRSTVTGSGFERTVSNSTTPSWDKEMDVKFAWLPDVCHQERTRWASGSWESKIMEPACSKEAVRPPLNSFTVTPLRQTRGWPSKTLSSCLARSPQIATMMLFSVSSARVISRFTRSFPSFEVNSNVGFAATMMPQRSTLQGKAFDCNERKSTKLNRIVSILPSSATASMAPSLSNTIS
mmetsp:Transcript_68626/g.192356  ORF Transcript_68626/g.192356 Transcript_68626/m.192356 type:complete len:214 (+) Transcript_68626:973-1614(+)